MLRSSSSLLGKVLKISLLGKGLCRNKPHLHANSTTQTHKHKHTLCYSSSLALSDPSCPSARLEALAAGVHLCRAAQPARPLTTARFTLAYHTWPWQVTDASRSHPHLILLKLFLRRLGSTSRW